MTMSDLKSAAARCAARRARRARASAVAVLVVLWPAICAGGPVLERAAKLLGVDRVASIEYRASGRYFQFSQAPAPGAPWPPFDVMDYTATLDYARDQSHVKYRRTQVVEAARARPVPVEQLMDQYVVGEFAWNNAPAATSLPQNAQDRHAEIWGSPHGFVKAALRHGARESAWKGGGAWIRFAIGPHRYEGGIDAAGEVREVRTWVDTTVLGDTPYEFVYFDYQDFDGVRFPTRIERDEGGFPLFRLDVHAVRVNTAAAIAVPAEVAKDPLPAVTVEVTTIAPGVHYFMGGTHHSVVVEQVDHVVVIEAPLDERRSLAVMDKVRELTGGKPIRFVINTHVHFDHAGGLRTYVNAGAEVVTAAANQPYYEAAWAQPRTLNPDSLAKSRLVPRFRTLTDKLVLTDGRRVIEVHAIVGSGHADGFSMVWLPREQLLVEADAWTPASGPASSAVVNPYWRNLDDNIRRLDLPVRLIAPLHGPGLKTIDELRAAISAD